MTTQTYAEALKEQSIFDHESWQDLIEDLSDAPAVLRQLYFTVRDRIPPTRFEQTSGATVVDIVADHTTRSDLETAWR